MFFAFLFHNCRFRCTVAVIGGEFDRDSHTGQPAEKVQGYVMIGKAAHDADCHAVIKSADAGKDIGTGHKAGKFVDIRS